ncbi:MAG TPA: cytochrome c [Flavisolibacter sp.]|jgi:mono/diheme cytochrome c family protein|nr:cytochrome c [Flavisolibacter sp.]
MKAVVFMCLLLPLFGVAQVKKSSKKATTPTGNGLQQSVSKGKVVYAAYCLSCHQADGSGVPNLNPPLVQNNWVLGPKNVLIEQVLNGSRGKVEIDGETFHNTMPPMAHLTDQQIADVITYVRNSFGNKASRVAPAEVKALRAKTK